MKNIILSLMMACLFIVAAQTATAQNANANKAKAYYFQAEKAYNAQSYQAAWKHITKAEELLGKANPTTLALRIKIHFAQEDYAQAQTLLDQFYEMDAGPNLSQEMSEYLVTIDVKIQEKKDRLAREKVKARQLKAAAKARRAREALKAAKAEKAKKEKELAADRVLHKRLVKECQNKILRACHNLGYRYHHGKSLAANVDFQKAADYYALGCNPAKKYTFACNNLGLLFETRKISPNYRNFSYLFPKGKRKVRSVLGKPEAFILYKMGCDAGDAKYACWNLAKLYHRGYNDFELDGRAKLKLWTSHGLARTYYAMACNAKNDSACRALAKMGN